MTPDRLEFFEQQEAQLAMQNRHEYLNDTSTEYPIVEEDIEIPAVTDVHEEYPEVAEDTLSTEDMEDTYFEILNEDTDNLQENPNEKRVADPKYGAG